MFIHVEVSNNNKDLLQLLPQLFWFLFVLFVLLFVLRWEDGVLSLDLELTDWLG